MKKATITASSFKKSFSSQYGELFSHTISLDNGDTGELNAKEEMPDWIRQGQTLYYDITENGKYAPKIKRISDKKQIEQYEKANGVSNRTAPEASNSTEIQVLRDEIEKLKEVIKTLVVVNKLKYIALTPALQKPQPEPVGKYEQQLMNDNLPDDSPF